MDSETQAPMMPSWLVYRHGGNEYFYDRIGEYSYSPTNHLGISII